MSDTTTTIFRNIEIYNKAYFSVSLTLDNQSVNMSFVWNDKTKRYHATLVKTNGTVVFEGLAVNTLTDFPLNHSMFNNSLYGRFVLYPLDDGLVETEDTMKNWRDYYFLVYKITF